MQGSLSVSDWLAGGGVIEGAGPQLVRAGPGTLVGDAPRSPPRLLLLMVARCSPQCKAEREAEDARIRSRAQSRRERIRCRPGVLSDLG